MRLYNKGRRISTNPDQLSKTRFMKKYLLSVICILVSLVMMQSCVKEVAQQTETVKEIIIDTTITAGSDYVLNLAKYGNDNDVAKILEPGKNVSVSQLENIDDMFTTHYHYSPSLKNSGTDYVTLSVSGNTDGAKDSTLIYINFTIK